MSSFDIYNNLSVCINFKNFVFIAYQPTRDPNSNANPK